MSAGVAMLASNSGPVTDIALIALLLAAAAGGTLAGGTVVAVDARMSGIVDAIPRTAWTAGPAGISLVGLALADAPRGPDFAGVLAIALAAFAVALLRGAVRIVVAEERRERTAPRRRPAA